MKAMKAQDPKRRRYFFFDIDGTLTNDATKQVVPSAVEALHALQKAGHFVAIATGRAWYKTRPVSEQIGIRNVVCCGGGGLVLDGKLIENMPLDHDTAQALIRHAEADGRGMLLLLDDSYECWMKDFRFLEQVGLRQEPTTYMYDPDLDPHRIPDIYKIYMPLTRAEEAENPWTQMQGHLFMTPEYAVFQHDRKHEGIQRMIELVHGNLEDVVVFGDAVNDLVMFDPRWLSIAMGNGDERLKQKADYVTAANTDDGILKACRHFGWIR